MAIPALTIPITFGTLPATTPVPASDWDTCFSAVQTVVNQLVAQANATSTTNAPLWAVAGGTANAITATYSQAIPALFDGLTVGVRASGTNTASVPTFTPTFGTFVAATHQITRDGGFGLSLGDISGSFAEIILVYNLANTRWELANPARSLEFISSPQAIPAAGSTLTVAHGLNVQPYDYDAFLQCVTNDTGYVTTDPPVKISTANVAASNSNGVQMYADATNVNVVIGSGGLALLNKGTGTAAAITAANWKMIVRAWL